METATRSEAARQAAVARCILHGIKSAAGAYGLHARRARRASTVGLAPKLRIPSIGGGIPPEAVNNSLRVLSPMSSRFISFPFGFRVRAGAPGIRLHARLASYSAVHRARSFLQVASSALRPETRRVECSRSLSSSSRSFWSEASH